MSARRPCSLRSGLWTLALLLASPVSLLAGGGPFNTLVVVNTNSADSVELGTYYAAAHGIPAHQICPVGIATLAVVGTAARVSPGFITVDGWGAAVGAGSPVIDGEGLVAGVISTAAPSAGGRLYDAVPVKFALELLDQLQ